MTGYSLPKALTVGGREYAINTDYRDILEIIGYLTDESKPSWYRWLLAVSLFYEGEIPPQDTEDAMQALSDFIAEGDTGKPGQPQVIDWQQDSKMIIADVNKVAGQEIRALPYLHWWTFLAFFRGIGEGQLSTVVGIRQKLAAHKKLEKWEQEYYQHHRDVVEIRRPETPEEAEEKDRLRAILGIKK